MFCTGIMKLNNQNYILYNEPLYKRRTVQKSKINDTQTLSILNSKQNSTIKKPAQAISFGGIFDLGFSLVEFVNDNEAAYNSIYSLLVAGILKPMAVLAMPGSEEKDKQMVATKNFLQAFLGSFLSFTIGGGLVKKAMDNIKNNLKLITYNEQTSSLDVLSETSKTALEIAKQTLKKEKKSFTNKITAGVEKYKQSSNAMTGLGNFFKTLGGKIEYEPTMEEVLSKSKEIVTNIKNNHLAIYSKNPNFVALLKRNNLISKDVLGHQVVGKTEIADAFESFWKNSTGSATAIAKAMLASALLPPVLKLLFAKKNKMRESEMMSKQPDMLKNSKSFIDKKANFKPFNNFKTTQNDISFKGNLVNGAVACTTQLVEKGAMSALGEKCAKILSFAKKPSARMSDIESVLITAYWVQNTIRSKKIDPKQKFGFNLHTILVTIVSSACAFVLDWLLDGFKDKRRALYEEKIENIAKQVEIQYPHLASVNLDLFEKVGNKQAMNDVQLAQYAITEELNRLLSDKSYVQKLSANKDETVKSLVEYLNSISLIGKHNPVDKDLVEKAINNLSIEKELQENISQIAGTFKGALFNEKGVVKELSKVFLYNKETISENPEILKNAVKNLSKNYDKKMSKFKSLTIFTLVVRFLVPVFMVPVTGKLKKKYASKFESFQNNRKKQKVKA